MFTIVVCHFTPDALICVRVRARDSGMELMVLSFAADMPPYLR